MDNLSNTQKHCAGSNKHCLENFAIEFFACHYSRPGQFCCSLREMLSKMAIKIFIADAFHRKIPYCANTFIWD